MNEQELAALAKQHGVTPQALLAALSAVAQETPTVVSRVPDDEYGYIVTLKDYNLEAFISWREARSLDEAIERATHDSNTKWWSKANAPEIPRDKVVGRYITRDEWCSWVRS